VKKSIPPTITDPIPQDPLNKALFEFSDNLRLGNLLPQVSRLRSAVSALFEARETGKIKTIQKACMEIVKLFSSTYKIDCPSLTVLGKRPLGVLGNFAIEKFGDYSPLKKHIRVWMRTPRRIQVAAPRTLLHTLIEEFCHHLDWEIFWRAFYNIDMLLYYGLLSEKSRKERFPMLKYVLDKIQFCYNLDRESFWKTVSPKIIHKKLGQGKINLSLHTRGFYARMDELYYHALGTSEAERLPLSWKKASPSGRYVRV
jgi:hypothetical protein